MAKKREEAPPKKREAPPKAVESEDDSEESDDDDGVMADEFEGVGEEVDSGDEKGVGFGSESESEEEVDIGEGPRRLLGRIMDAGGFGDSEDSMEGSRSRSEEDLRDIGSARRLDDDDTGDSAWKEAAGPSSSSVVGKEKSDGDVAVARVLDDEEEEVVEEEGGAGADAMKTDEEEEEEEEEEVVEEEGGAGADAMKTDEEEEEEAEAEEDVDEAESRSEGEPSASVSVEDGSDSDSDKGDKGDGEQPTAYSRAFSKILQQSKAAKESDTGPVLAARQTLVARKLEEEAGETKENKDTRKEKKELREKAHMYPQSYTDTKEKDLVKLATRGVVKLFNAVSKAQKVQASADGRDAKVVAKQSKSAFLAEVRGTGSSVAVGSKRSHSSTSAPPFKFGASESQNQPTSRWSVVKDDFMLGKQKLKDWDKDEEMGDAAGVQQLNNGIDDDSD